MQACQEVTGVPPRVVSKPTGGFRPISVVQVCLAWWAYQTGLLPRYLDFRVYLALHEIDERRLAAARLRIRNGKPAVNLLLTREKLIRETRTLVGGKSDRVVAGALRRLESLGLVRIEPSSFSFATNLDSIAVNEQSDSSSNLRELLQRSNLRDRRVPVPRKMLGYLARGSRPCVAATAFGYLFRCVWWRKDECHVDGRCASGFISDVFGVDVRSVKRARKELRRMGWLALGDADAAEYSHSLVPNLIWPGVPAVDARQSVDRPDTVLSPRATISDTGMSPPTRSIQLRSGSKDQKPYRRRLTGIRGGKAGNSRPRLSNIQPTDLSSVERLAVLFEEASSSGLVKQVSADRLRFFAAAARASRLGSRNPCGFFAAIVRRGLWHVISQTDEDRAIEWLRVAGGIAPSPPSAPRQLSDSTANPIRHGHCDPAGVAGIQSLVASLSVHCSMDKSPQVSRKCQHDQSPGCAPAARVPIGPRSKGPSAASGRGAMGWDTARACGRASGGLSLNDGNGSRSECIGEDGQEGWRPRETLAVGEIMRRMGRAGMDPDGSSGVSVRIESHMCIERAKPGALNVFTNRA